MECRSRVLNVAHLDFGSQYTEAWHHKMDPILKLSCYNHLLIDSKGNRLKKRASGWIFSKGNIVLGIINLDINPP